MRRKKLILNTIAAIFSQLVTFTCGLVVPRLIIEYYGSATNGLISSITHFLAFFAVTELGINAVVRASLYKPLAVRDENEVSKVLISSKRFFNKIGFFLCLYSLLLMVYFPLFVDHSNGYFGTAVLVFAIAFHSIASYLFGIVYVQLLNADQCSYVQLTTTAFTTVLSTIFAVVLIHLGASVETMKVCAALVFIVKPFLLRWYVNRHYHLDFSIKFTGEPIKQKWNGLAQHIATYVLKHADVVILTWFSTLTNVSIYYVYNLVVNGLYSLIAVLNTGTLSLFGDMIAKNEKVKLDKTFSAFEMLLHAFVTFLFAVAGMLIIPFIQVYTQGITDTNYIVPAFAVVILLANGMFCLRIPYNLIVMAAGHFKETQNSAFIEAGLNIVVSVILVIKYGLVGVAIGTLVAMTYRTIYLAWYLRTHILNRPFRKLLGHFGVDFLCVVGIIVCTSSFKMETASWWHWVICACKTATAGAFVVGTMHTIFYHSLLKETFYFVFRKKRSNY